MSSGFVILLKLVSFPLPCACTAGDLGSIPGVGKIPGGGQGKPVQYSCLENPHGQRFLASYSPWGCKESDSPFLLFQK